jgi:DNA-binding transcriptional regulator GbsR (MarR family)
MVSPLQILTSQAQIQVLKTLMLQPDPLRLRPLSTLAQLPVRSVELALKHLIHLKLIQKRKFENFFGYQINSNHQFFPFFRNMFQDEQRFMIQQRSRYYQKLAKTILPFQSKMHRFLDGPRRSLEKNK